MRRCLLDAPDLDELRAALGVPEIGMMRPGEPLFRDLGLSRDDAEETLLAAMAAHPALIERPIVLAGGRAALGRPPENVPGII